jgi:hypothetical protein
MLLKTTESDRPHTIENINNHFSQQFYFPREKGSGFILIVSLVVLMLLTIIGISATRFTSVELQIAGNDKVHKSTFYQADGGSEVGILMVEENVSCPTGFNAPVLSNNDPGTFLNLQGVQVADSNFAYDEGFGDIPGSPASIADLPSDTARSIRIPFDMASATDASPHTNIAIFGDTQLAAGSAIQMAAGYDGKGKGAGASGAFIAYDIHSQHLGVQSSETVLRVEWKHLIGQEGICNY